MNESGVQLASFVCPGKPPTPPMRYPAGKLFAFSGRRWGRFPSQISLLCNVNVFQSSFQLLSLILGREIMAVLQWKTSQHLFSGKKKITILISAGTKNAVSTLRMITINGKTVGFFLSYYKFLLKKKVYSR